MYSQYYILKAPAVTLRKKGKTYGEIQRIIGKPIPKSTLSHWFRGILLTESQQRHINKRVFLNIRRAQAKAWIVNKRKREGYIRNVIDRIRHLPIKLRNNDTAKIALAMLYFGEGYKRHNGSLIFGNSDPAMIKLFLHLLRYCYDIDESKFRCTLQCRADQDIKKLEQFWSKITKIPASKFYRARIDPRTRGKPSKKLNYKGVCRIDYFSGDIFMEIMQIIGLISKKI